jgi:hypothetical protein
MPWEPAGPRLGREQLLEAAALVRLEHLAKPAEKLIMPVFCTSSIRPAGSFDRFTSANGSPRASRRSLTRRQKEHGSVV